MKEAGKLSQYLDAVEARTKAASPGPWQVDDLCVFDGVGDHMLCVDGWGGCSDTEFIANSRTDVERLTALVRAYAGAWNEACKMTGAFTAGDGNTSIAVLSSFTLGELSEKYGLEKS